MQRRSLAPSTGCTIRRADARPQAGPVDVLSEDGQQRGDQQQPPDQQDHVAISFQISRTPDHEERDEVEGDPEGRPAGLHLGIARIPTRDDHVPDAVEEEDQRKKDGARFGRKPAIAQHGPPGPAPGRSRGSIRCGVGCGTAAAKDAIRYRATVMPQA